MDGNRARGRWHPAPAIGKKPSLGILVVAVFVLGLTLMSTRSAYGYCSGPPFSSGNFAGGGSQDFSLFGGLQAVSGYIKGGNYSPVPGDASAWVMLHDRWVSDGRYAQDGWIKRNIDSSYLVFAEWNPGGRMLWVSGPQFSHTYEVDALADNSYQFWYDGFAWFTTTGGQGWWPNQTEYFSESHDQASHFPGSIGYEIEHWLLAAKNNEQWVSADLSSGWLINDSSGQIVGRSIVSAHDFYTWDRRCSDAPTG